VVVRGTRGEFIYVAASGSRKRWVGGTGRTGREREKRKKIKELTAGSDCLLHLHETDL